MPEKQFMITGKEGFEPSVIIITLVFKTAGTPDLNLRALRPKCNVLPNCTTSCPQILKFKLRMGNLRRSVSGTARKTTTGGKVGAYVSGEGGGNSVGRGFEV